MCRSTHQALDPIINDQFATGSRGMSTGGLRHASCWNVGGTGKKLSRSIADGIVYTSWSDEWVRVVIRHLVGPRPTLKWLRSQIGHLSVEALLQALRPPRSD